MKNQIDPAVKDSTNTIFLLAEVLLWLIDEIPDTEMRHKMRAIFNSSMQDIQKAQAKMERILGQANEGMSGENREQYRIAAVQLGTIIDTAIKATTARKFDEFYKLVNNFKNTLGNEES